MVALNRFAWLERVMCDCQISARAARLAGILALRYANKAAECWPAQSRLALDLGLKLGEKRDNGPNTVRVLTIELERRGYLALSRGTGRQSTKYTLILPDRAGVAAVAPTVDAAKVHKARDRARALDHALARLQRGLSLEVENGFSQDVVDEARASFSTRGMLASVQGGCLHPPRGDETRALRGDAGIPQTSIENLSNEPSASARGAAEGPRALALIAPRVAA